ncbi:MAG: methyltransferase domain-containing protein [Dermatophilaceae bacterium]
MSDDLILSAPGDVGICRVYNKFLEEARNRNDCEAVVLLHDDVEIIDPNFRPKIVEAVAQENVGVVGAIGGADLTNLAWWDARERAGRVFETRGVIDFGDRRRDLDVVDGLMLVLAPSAFRTLSFDDISFPDFHGYDVDYCLQVRSKGLRVVLAPINLLHRTKGGLGDQQAFELARIALARKWPNFLHTTTPVESLQARMRTSVQSGRRHGATVRRGVRSILARSNSGQTSGSEREVSPGREVIPQGSNQSEISCPCCTTQVSRLAHETLSVGASLQCEHCGTGITWPPPNRDVEGDGLWKERYGASRLARRSIWISEALKRVEWLQLYVPDGCLLEIGSGTGEFLRVATDQGYETYGVEASRWAAEEAQKLGVEIETGYLSDWRARYRDLRPDVVAIWHVLEHVPDPVSFLGEIRSTLRPGGTLVLEVPNGSSSTFKRLGLEWDAAQPDDHFFHFSPHGLELMLGAAGFAVQHTLPISRRIYLDAETWQREYNEALLNCTDWPPLDLLRAVCVVGDLDSSARRDTGAIPQRDT